MQNSISKLPSVLEILISNIKFAVSLIETKYHLP